MYTLTPASPPCPSHCCPPLPAPQASVPGIEMLVLSCAVAIAVNASQFMVLVRGVQGYHRSRFIPG